MGDLGVLFFEGFWKETCLLIKNKMNERNPIVYLKVESWDIWYLSIYDTPLIAKKINCYTKNLLCQNVLYQEHNNDQTKNAKTLD